MKRSPLKLKILKAKEMLEADDQQMARHLGMTIDTYRAIESGGRVLPLPAQKSVMRRAERLLQRCGISTEPLKQL